MLIVCPACASEYVIDIDRVGSEGRSVRCAACRETWFISPDDVAAARAAERGEEPASGRVDDQAALDAWEAALAEEGVSFGDPDPAPAPPPSEKPKARGRKKKAVSSKRRPRLSLAASIGLAVLASLPLALLARTSVVRAMPQSAGVYARLGLPVNLRGLELRDVVAYQVPGEGGQTQLVVEGDLVGIAARAATVPPIEVEVRDGRDQSLYRWTLPAPRPVLENRETARFRASLSTPPVEGRSVQVRFATITASEAKLDAKADASAKHP
ncbi:zinc-ribbon domain-containing protein [Methylobacterium iners]|uniref:Zinc finger/thioredoxin putative domain-containing protein n=1 Tax=Methylobacterium iners TaxID=418707 RepID=A0ABQ4S1X3_9HYPH|nr:zinc-ribbon domain-containing protein [Methylobacterium iners]GJD95924.1 hypothetical protein OCOJLMKI_3141 [Methylobacterium iners]